MPPLLNPNPIFDDSYDQVAYDTNRVKMLQGVQKQLQSEAIYKTSKKKARRVGGGFNPSK